MTAHRAISNRRTRKQFNQKDGRLPRTGKVKDFTPANEWVQGGQDGLTEFKIGPGIKLVDGIIKPIMVARCETAEIEIDFPATMDYQLIRRAVDDEILRIKRSDAAADEPIDWDEWKSEGLVYDF